jgi:hypothetical protein
MKGKTMTDLTHDDVDNMLTQTTDEDVRETLLEVKSLLVAFDSETDAGLQEQMMVKIRDLNSVLQHELSGAGHDFDDYVNDGVFHKE